MVTSKQLLSDMRRSSVAAWECGSLPSTRRIINWFERCTWSLSFTHFFSFILTIFYWNLWAALWPHYLQEKNREKSTENSSLGLDLFEIHTVNGTSFERFKAAELHGFFMATDSRPGSRASNFLELRFQLRISKFRIPARNFWLKSNFRKVASNLERLSCKPPRLIRPHNLW